MNKVVVTILAGYLFVVGVSVACQVVASHKGYIKGCEGVMVNMLHAFDVKNIDYADLEKFCEEQRLHE